MRRAKIMLNVIVVIAVIGGVLAFRANSFSAIQLFYVTTDLFVIGETTCTTSNFVTAIQFGVEPPISNLAGNYIWYTTDGCVEPVFGFETVE